MRSLFMVLNTAAFVANIVETYAYNTVDSTNLLWWAPITLKQPFLTLINDFYNPTWKTRHPITKREESLRHLSLPYGVPFSTICGACFQMSTIKANLSISITGHTYQSVPKLHNGRTEKFRVGYLDCMMSYMITAPIERNGKITCTLQRGRQRKAEVISFDAVEVSIDNSSEEHEIQSHKQNMALHCPLPNTTQTPGNPLVQVWHEDSATISPTTPIIPEVTPTITVQHVTNARTIICSVYNIGWPRKVYQTRYHIVGNLALTKHTLLGSNDFPIKDSTRKEKFKVTMIITVIAVSVGTFIMVIAIIHLRLVRKKARVHASSELRPIAH